MKPKIFLVLGVEVLAKGCPGLMTFLSRGCILIGDDALTHLARYCPRLHTVNIQGCLVMMLVYRNVYCLANPNR